jgi:hypothetical protein
MRTGMTAFRLSMGKALVPFAFVYTPALLFVDFTWGQFVASLVGCLVAILGLGAAYTGYAGREIGRPAFLVLNVLSLSLIFGHAGVTAGGRAHPGQAALRTQAGHVQRLDRRHLAVRRQRAPDLVLGALALHRHPDTAGRQARAGQGTKSASDAKAREVITSKPGSCSASTRAWRHAGWAAPVPRPPGAGTRPSCRRCRRRPRPRAGEHGQHHTGQAAAAAHVQHPQRPRRRGAVPTQRPTTARLSAGAG